MKTTIRNFGNKYILNNDQNSGQVSSDDGVDGMDDAVTRQDVKAGDVGAACRRLDGDELGVTDGGDLFAAGSGQRVAARGHILALR